MLLLSTLLFSGPLCPCCCLLMLWIFLRWRHGYPKTPTTEESRTRHSWSSQCTIRPQLKHYDLIIKDKVSSHIFFCMQAQQTHKQHRHTHKYAFCFLPLYMDWEERQTRHVLQHVCLHCNAFPFSCQCHTPGQALCGDSVLMHTIRKGTNPVLRRMPFEHLDTMYARRNHLSTAQLCTASPDWETKLLSGWLTWFSKPIPSAFFLLLDKLGSLLCSTSLSKCSHTNRKRTTS